MIRPNPAPNNMITIASVLLLIRRLPILLHLTISPVPLTRHTAPRATVTQEKVQRRDVSRVKRWTGSQLSCSPWCRARCQTELAHNRQAIKVALDAGTWSPRISMISHPGNVTLRPVGGMPLKGPVLVHEISNARAKLAQRSHRRPPTRKFHLGTQKRNRQSAP